MLEADGREGCDWSHEGMCVESWRRPVGIWVGVKVLRIKIPTLTSKDATLGWGTRRARREAKELCSSRQIA